MLFLRPKKNSPFFASVVQPAGSDANWKRSHLRPRLPLVMSQRERMLVTYSAFVFALCVEVDPTKCSFFGRRQIHFNFVWEAANRGLRAPFVSDSAWRHQPRMTGLQKGKVGPWRIRTMKDILFSIWSSQFSSVTRLRCRNVAAVMPLTTINLTSCTSCTHLTVCFACRKTWHMATAGDSVSNQTQLCKVWTIYM